MVLKARAIYDCKADDLEELSFNEKAIIVDIVKSSDEGWFEGTLEGTKTRGLFPENYVEFFEEEPKRPPKLPPRKTSDNSIGAKTSSMPLFDKKHSDDPINNSDKTDAPLPEPKKLSAAKFAVFELSNNNDDDNINPSQKPPQIKKPKPKVSSVNTEISSRSIRFNSDEKEHEVTTPQISVDKIKSMLERNTKEPAPLPLKTPTKPVTSLKPTNNPPPIAPKPGKLAPPLPSRPSSMTSMTSITDKKPPLPPRRQNNTPTVNSSNEVPPLTSPRPDFPNSYLTKNVDKATTKARTGAQDFAGEAAKQSVSVGFSQLKNDLSRSKYGDKKIPGQNALFDKAEKHAQDIASDQAKKKVGETCDKNLNNTRSKSTSKPSLPARNNILSNINNQIRNTDIKIPRRPTSHNNPFSENDLSKGISPDMKKRYEIIYDANKDDDDYIDGAVVKAIYLKSCLDNKTLFKIWNLLDNDEDGRLSRNEFCAGMFLIDERLKGHPIPDELPYELLE